MRKTLKIFSDVFQITVRMFSFLDLRDRVFYVFAFLCYVVQNFFANYLVANCIRNLLNALLYGGNALVPVATFAVQFSIFAASLGFGFYGMQYISAQSAMKLREAMMRACYGAQMGAAGAFGHTAQIQSRLDEDAGTAANLISFGLSNWFLPYVAGIGVLIVFLRLDPILLIPLTAGAVIELLVHLKMAPEVQNRTARAAQAQADMLEEFADQYNGLEIVKNYGLCGAMLGAFRRVCGALFQGRLALAKLECRQGAVRDISRWLGYTGTLLLGCAMLKIKSFSLPDLVFAAQLACVLQTTISNLGANLNGVQESLVSARRAFEVLDQPQQDRREGLPEMQPAPGAALTVSDLHFDYAGREVLRGVNASFEAGRFYAIVGPSGCGKSTLLRVMMGLYAPSVGMVALGDCRQEAHSFRAWRRYVRFVPQETALFDASIGENILLGLGDAQDGQLSQARQAARMAQVDDFIENLPDQYRTNAGEAGKLLSGGERQRILIARGLVGNTAVLLLDEPTASLDALNEAEILKNLQSIARSGVLVIMATHRESSMNYVDQVFRMEDGVLLPCGA